MIKEKDNKLNNSGQLLIIILISGLVKITLLDKMRYYPELDNSVRNKLKINLDLSNYVTKSDKEKGKDIKMSNLAASCIYFKSMTKKLDKNKLKTIKMIYVRSVI